ncbi:MAG: CAP domain-containing protein [Syntrophales bacterium]
MKRILSLLTLLISLLAGGAVAVVSAAEVAPSPQEEALLGLINQARLNPLAVAAAMGMDPEKILQDLPELEKILKEGLPPVTFNGTLHATARAHTADMFANSYYSSVAPDGRGYEQRIRDAGYPAVASGESLGMLAFANFIDPQEAARFLFEYMYWDELDPARTEKRNILDPLLKEAGVSVDTGALNLGGSLWNVYLATCDYGAIISGPEAQLLELINQARENPLRMAATLGMDPEQILADLPEWHDLLTQGLPPLTLHAGLQKAAAAHAADMLANGYYSHDSLDGRTFQDRLREAGYDPLNATESILLGCQGSDSPVTDPDQIRRLVQVLFAEIFTRELRPYSPEEKFIFAPALNEVGIGLALGSSAGLAGVCGENVVLLVADFGLRSE